jgi:hypothetical protein
LEQQQVVKEMLALLVQVIPMQVVVVAQAQ